MHNCTARPVNSGISGIEEGAARRPKIYDVECPGKKEFNDIKYL